jgi:Domain of unknown function (DUF4062)
MTLAPRPKVFISSTVYDFRDLRSALKSWIENRGFDVLMSEYNDFSKPLDVSTYDACLEAIRNCQYFVLLIGGRAGAYYDKNNRISVTRREYREAYECLQQRRLKILSFVRKEIWNVRADRKALQEALSEDYCRTHGIAQEERKELVAHKSELVNDADDILAFIAEVAKEEEVAKASLTGGPFPIGNWVHSFDNFSEITDALRMQFLLSSDTDTMAVKANLEQELLSDLQQLMRKKNGTIERVTRRASASRDAFAGDLMAASDFDPLHLNHIMEYSLFGLSAGYWLDCRALDAAINSGCFLEIDVEGSAYRIGLVQKAMIDLRNGITRLKDMKSQFETKITEFNTAFLKNAQTKQGAQIPNHFLIVLYAMADAQDNVIDLISALLSFLQGNLLKLNELKLRPSSPLAKGSDNMFKEVPTIEELRSAMS